MAGRSDAVALSLDTDDLTVTAHASIGAEEH
jgi:hypothetical protein